MCISVAVIDSANGRPAAGIGVVLWRGDNAQWRRLADGNTDELGGVPTLGDNGAGTPRSRATGNTLERGRYRLRFDLDPYFAGFGITPFQSSVEVVFRVFHPGEHVRLLLFITSSSCDAHVIPCGDRADTRSVGLKDEVEYCGLN